MRLSTFRAGAIALAALALLGRPAAADDSKLNKLRQDHKDDKLARALGEMVIAAAHPTAQKVAYLEHKMKDDPGKDIRKVMTVKMEYHGKVTGKRYVADIDIKFDVVKGGWEVIDIDYVDNNNIKASLANIQSLKKKLNQPE
jgi:hypothetical protein